MSEVPQLWTPEKFSGTDLLPVSMGGEMDTTGREHVSADDLVLPVLTCLQGQSDPVTQGAEGARPGRFWHNGAQEAFEGPLRVLLCAHTKSRALFPKAKNPAHAGLERCISRDNLEGDRYGSCDACPHKEWGKNNEPPACSESHNFVALTAYGPAVIRFARTSYKAAKNFVTTWTMSPKPLYAHPTILTAKPTMRKVDGKDTTFYTVEMKWAQREAVPPAVQEAAHRVYEQVSRAHEAGKFGTDDVHDDDA